MGKELNEDLVGAAGVRQVSAGRDRLDAVSPDPWRRSGTFVLDGEIARGEQPGDPMGLAPLAGADRGEPVHPPQAPQPVQACARRRGRVEQHGAQLTRGEGAVLDEQSRGDVVAGLQLLDEGEQIAGSRARTAGAIRMTVCGRRGRPGRWGEGKG